MPANDTAFGLGLLGIGIVLVLAIVFAITMRTGRGAASRAAPPPGVHMPSPSMLPVVLSVGAALLGAGLAFRANGQLANPFLAIPGLLVLLYAIWGWVRDAGREWRDVERGPHDDAQKH
ncbi:MAG TPA: hypothetical protein VEW45_03450 [Candidatus Dormibacteraeota bacterium]|nr:hypothetical protein [Candidatus Dormibacteraeota bacterium]